MSRKTIGEQRVRASFNPSGYLEVDDIKQKTAKIIDILEKMKGDGKDLIPWEKVRLIDAAQDAYELAAMWAVKAETYTEESE